MDEVVDLKSMFKFFWKRRKQLLYIAISVFVFANIVFFIRNDFVFSNVGKVKMALEATSSRVASYNDLIKSDTIINSAISISNIDVNSEIIKRNVSVSASDGSRIYTITLNYKNRDDGKKLCELIINEFINHIGMYDGNNAVFFDSVSTTGGPINFSIIKNELLYFTIGCMVSFCYCFALFFLDNKIKSINELMKYNILGIIDDSKNSVCLIKTKIKLSCVGKVIFLSTARDINCKNDILRLVNEFSKDSKTIFIDTNIRNNKTKNIGYANLLDTYKDDFSKYISKYDNYDVFDFGTSNKECEILLSSKNNEKLLRELSKKYDYIIVYNSNVIDYSDSLILSKLCDCNYMIVGINQTDKRDFQKSVDVYKQIGTDVNGIIIIDKEKSNKGVIWKIKN